MTDASGRKVVWLWDYKNDRPALESEMTKEQLAESERAKYEGLRKAIEAESGAGK